MSKIRINKTEENSTSGGRLLSQELISYRYSACCYSSFSCAILLKSQMLHRFKSDRAEIWQQCSKRTYASIEGVRFLI